VKEKQEGREERGEEKRTPGTHNSYIAYFGDERQKSSRDTPVQTPRPWKYHFQKSII